MTRTVKCVGILFLGCLLFSCATMQKINGTTPDEQEKFKTSKDQLWDANKRYDAENRKLQSQIEQLKKDAEGNEVEISELHNTVAALKEKTAESEPEKPAPTPNAPDPVLKKPLENLKIKVLGGDGTLVSANKMATRLLEMGYRVKIIHLAPTSNFSKNTVFYKQNVKGEAEDLVARMGGNTISKVLTWESIFDLVVVTGKS
jgi:predicted RNase H-like nuclease (RuvC/YqgF family)